MQTVTGKMLASEADVETLKAVVENRRDCGGGTHRERKSARRELRRRGYQWYVIFGEGLQPQVNLLHEGEAHQGHVWSRGCVSPGAAYDRWNRNRP